MVKYNDIWHHYQRKNIATEEQPEEEVHLRLLSQALVNALPVVN